MADNQPKLNDIANSIVTAISSNDKESAINSLTQLSVTFNAHIERVKALINAGNFNDAMELIASANSKNGELADEEVSEITAAKAKKVVYNKDGTFDIVYAKSC